MTSSIIAYQKNEASLVASLEYSYLIFVVILDFAIWHFIPSVAQILGGLGIICSGFIIVWRESKSFKLSSFDKNSSNPR